MQNGGETYETFHVGAQKPSIRAENQPEIGQDDSEAHFTAETQPLHDSCLQKCLHSFGVSDIRQVRYTAFFRDSRFASDGSFVHLIQKA
jgi:hypothetical protein